jgi:hypothetical protein
VYHLQVSEVLAASSNKCRLSVSGWFHGKPFKRPPTYVEPVKHLSKPEDMDVSIPKTSWKNEIVIF